MLLNVCQQRLPVEDVSVLHSKGWYSHLFFPPSFPRYHDEVFVAPGISIMMIDTSLSKRTFLIDFATPNLHNLALRVYTYTDFGNLRTPWLGNVGSRNKAPSSTIHNCGNDVLYSMYYQIPTHHDGQPYTLSSYAWTPAVVVLTGRILDGLLTEQMYRAVLVLASPVGRILAMVGGAFASFAMTVVGW